MGLCIFLTVGYNVRNLFSRECFYSWNLQSIQQWVITFCCLEKGLWMFLHNSVKFFQIIQEIWVLSKRVICCLFKSICSPTVSSHWGICSSATKSRALVIAFNKITSPISSAVPLCFHPFIKKSVGIWVLINVMILESSKKKSSKYKKVKKGGNQKSKRDRKFVFAPFIYMPPLFFCCSSALCASWFVHCPGNCAVSMTTYSSQGRVRPGGIQ